MVGRRSNIANRWSSGVRQEGWPRVETVAVEGVVFEVVVVVVGMVVVAPKLIARYGPKAMVVTGLATLATGMLTLSLIRANGSFWVDVLPASLIWVLIR